MNGSGFGRRGNGASADTSTRRDSVTPAVEPNKAPANALEGGPDKAPANAPEGRPDKAPVNGAEVDAILDRLRAFVAERLSGGELIDRNRADLEREIQAILTQWFEKRDLPHDDAQIQTLTEQVLDPAPGISKKTESDSPPAPTDDQPVAYEPSVSVPEKSIDVPPPRAPRSRSAENGQKTNGIVSASKASVTTAKDVVAPILMERIDAAAAAKLTRNELAGQVAEIVVEILYEEKIRLNSLEQRDLVTRLLNDMLGLGPLEPLLADESVTDILVNGPKQVYVERAGKLEVTDVGFRDDAHVMNIATRIVTRIGRRVDESSPLCDARLEDGSRVNIIIPPLAVDGPSISIRKFAKKGITLDKMVKTKNLSPAIATVLQIAARSALNILISGGTGSGKTTLLNAISQMIDYGDRIVTIEDAAELQLQQPHVVRLETRPANLEGDGEITMRELVKNALRMRPDRIIVGEVRSSEAVDMLQAMNTGHEGSLGTIHANNPREALTRLENMVGMAGINLPSKAVRTQIASALDVIVQIARMRDGIRRITHVMEVVGMEGDVIVTQDLFNYKFEGEDSSGRLIGQFLSSGLRPHFMPKAEYFGLGRPLTEAIG